MVIEILMHSVAHVHLKNAIAMHTFGTEDAREQRSEPASSRQAGGTHWFPKPRLETPLRKLCDGVSPDADIRPGEVRENHSEVRLVAPCWQHLFSSGSKFHKLCCSHPCVHLRARRVSAF